jgi:hypothetical protein
MVIVHGVIWGKGNQSLQTSVETLQVGVGAMLEEWQENLAIMAANHTAGDDRVILHLGDCLWRARGEVGFNVCQALQFCMLCFAFCVFSYSVFPAFIWKPGGKGVTPLLSVCCVGR